MKIPTRVRVRVGGKGFNDLFWIEIIKMESLYCITVSWASGIEQPLWMVTDYEVKEAVFKAISKLYSEDTIEDVVMGWHYDEEDT